MTLWLVNDINVTKCNLTQVLPPTSPYILYIMESFPNTPSATLLLVNATHAPSIINLPNFEPSHNIMNWPFDESQSLTILPSTAATLSSRLNVGNWLLLTNVSCKPEPAKSLHHSLEPRRDARHCVRLNHVMPINTLGAQLPSWARICGTLGALVIPRVISICKLLEQRVFHKSPIEFWQ